MADYELFSLIGLSFDPPEKAPKKVLAAVDKAKKELSGALGTATQQLERDEINRKHAFLESCAIFSNDGKLTPAYEALAQAKTKQEMDNLTAAVSLLKQSGSHVVTNGTIRLQKNKTKLTKEHVEEVYHNAGFTITEIDPLKAMPKFHPNLNQIYTELEALRKSKDPNPNGADLTHATDLYAFAAYLVGEPENAAEYRSKSTPELASLLDGFAKKFSTRNDNLGKLCASLATAGKTYVFSSEDNRKAYEAYLKYKSPALTKLFSAMGRLSNADLLAPSCAEECIKQISAVFGSYEVSLAIYNKEAGLKDEPYIPIKAIFHVKCHHCQNIVEFTDVNEAQSINKCAHCGQALYKPCQKCRKSVLASLDKCPECGFVFASAAMFTKYFAAAEQAFRKSDFEAARNFLFQAQSADPSEKRRTDELATRIASEEKRYEKPIQELRKLIADKLFQKASAAVADMIGRFPGLNVSAFEAQIDTALSQARTAFANAKRFSHSRQADECLAILRDCVDFTPAIDYLHTALPESCKSFSVGIDSSAGCANVSWTRSTEQGIEYRLVRKPGKGMPTNEMDGEILIDDTKETSYRDQGIVPGQWYSYAVFAIRYGVFSSGIGKTIVLLADATDVHVERTNATVRLTWNTPTNSTGITICRTQNGKEAILAQNAHGSYEDKDVQYGITYSYMLSANYVGLPPSQGVSVVITHTLIISSFTIAAKQIKENNYKISWSIGRADIDLRVLVNEKPFRELKSGAGSCDLELPADGFHSVAVLAYSGGNWLRSENSLQMNTYSPCAIDKTSSYFREDTVVGLQGSAYRIELHLKVRGVIPSSVVGFYYAVRTGTAQNRWAASEEVRVASDIHRIELAAYRTSGEILYTETAREEGAYYVSLFTIYSMGGKEIISIPKPCRFDRPLTAELFWKISKSFMGGLKLSIEVYGNRPMSRVPEFVLCACADHQHLLSHTDPKATQLFTIHEAALTPSQNTYSGSYDLNEALSAKQLKGMKFFLFEVTPIPSERFTLRWSKGFIGRYR